MTELIARSHHEHWDGRGYPDGLVGTHIPLAARIVAVVDVFDALSHDRVHLPALPTQQVLKMMSDGRGTQFDPDVLLAFFDSLPQMRQVLENYRLQATGILEIEATKPRNFDEEPANIPAFANK